MHRIKRFFSYNKGIILETFSHTGFMWASLALSYNSYKEYIRGYENNIFPLEVKDAIKASFPLTIIMFVVLFIILSIWRDKKGYYNIRQYAVIFVIQAIIMNLIFFSKGNHILIVQNLAFFYLAVILVVWNGIREFTVIDTAHWLKEFIPPIVYRLTRDIPASFKQKPSAFFVKGFITVAVICAVLSLFKQIKAVKELANIAYFLIVIGVSIEAYKFIRYRERDNK